MNVNGIHHVSALTANAQHNLDFYVKGLGMKLIKKSVNQDDPTMYHLFYGDEVASPGSDLTFFEIPMLARRRKGRTVFRPYHFGFPVNKHSNFGRSGFMSSAQRFAASRRVRGGAFSAFRS